MKRTLFKILAMATAFAMTACDFTLLPTDNGSSEGGSSGTSSNNSSEVVSGSITTSTSASPKVSSVSVEDNKNYAIGDKYSITDLVVTVYYEDDTEETIASTKATVNKILNPLGQEITTTTKFNRAGEYTVKYDVNVSGKKYATNTKINVASGFDTAGFSITSIEYATKPSFHKGDVVKTLLNDISLLIHWNRGDEYYTYNIATDTSGLSFSLKKEGDDVTERIEEALVQGNTYNLILSYSGYNLNYQFTIFGNYYQLDSSDISYIQTDLDDSISPSKGNVKVLIIPIILKGNYIDEWTTSRLSQIDGYYFGTDTTKMSLKMYYETASFGQMNVSGTVSDPYTENSSSLTSDLIEADSSMSKVFQLIANAVSWIKSAHPEINLDEYDLNDDGAIDNIHLITNFNTDTYASETGNQVWSTPLWPHKYQTSDSSGTKLSPVANVYSISAINHVWDCVTAVHEQGHIFGLDDYYNYGDSDIDYIGHADMQSSNIFDWNSYSKFTVGWISPYVVTGETEVTLQAASINGDCLVIPANPSTFNNSAFDEYFLLELFSPYGNNATNYPSRGTYYGRAWDVYNASCDDLGDYGVRLYHVSSQIYEYTGSGFSPIDTAGYTSWMYQPTDNNEYSYAYRSSYFADWADYKQLAIIQQGGTDTFGNAGSRQYLNGDDLFHQGDVFTFNNYKHFLSKSGAAVTAMDNGETFPYKITFTSMSATNVTVKIENL